jgi:hypothetical protein
MYYGKHVVQFKKLLKEDRQKQDKAKLKRKYARWDKDVAITMKKGGKK